MTGCFKIIKTDNGETLEVVSCLAVKENNIHVPNSFCQPLDQTEHALKTEAKTWFLDSNENKKKNQIKQRKPWEGFVILVILQVK